MEVIHGRCAGWTKRRIQAVIGLLADDPRPPAAKKLTARPEWRVRTGDYRVLYPSEDPILTVLVMCAGQRRNVDDR